MKKNLITQALIGSLLTVAALSAQAKVSPFTMGFVTLADLEIDQVQALTFGQNVIGKTGTECTMTILATNAAGTTKALAVANHNDSLSGAGCLTVAAAATNNLMGVYGIKGSNSQTYNLTLGFGDSADFAFSPTGRVQTTGVAANSNGTDVFANSPQSATLSAGGLGYVVVGGTITIGAADLDANKPYNASFDITATY